MIDRDVEFLNRFRMTKVEGTDDIYDLIPAPGEVIALGDTFSKANMLPDSIPAALGLKMGNPQVKDALNVLANIGNVHVWQRVQSGVTDYLTSTDRNAYTEGTVDNTTITYLGQLGEPGARIEVGSYVGTGTYGTLNRCSLTFSSTPKMVFIKASNDARTMMLFYGHTRGDSTDSTSNKPFTTWDGNTVTWYADVSAYLQFNSSGDTYDYLAFY